MHMQSFSPLQTPLLTALLLTLAALPGLPACPSGPGCAHGCCAPAGEARPPGRVPVADQPAVPRH
jgi:hypothetical protein